MADYNINIRNRMSGGKGDATSKLSAKGSKKNIVENKNMFNPTRTANTINKYVSGGISTAQGSPTPASSMIKGGTSKMSVTMAVIGVTLSVAEKGLNFYADYKEAQTGETAVYNNFKAQVKTVASFGMNYIAGGIRNQIFTKKAVERKNQELFRGQQLYNINMFGDKYTSK